MNSKRRAPAIMSEVQKQARLDDGFAAPTPGAAMDESAFQFDDYGDDDAGGFDETAYNDYDVSKKKELCLFHSDFFFFCRMVWMNKEVTIMMLLWLKILKHSATTLVKLSKQLKTN
jgi:hypothetical protein